jgi:GNAT superfamily N-acetyltransferase
LIFAGAALARRLEAADAANAVGCARAQSGPGAAVEEIAGGWAVFAGVNSMLTHAIGSGMNGPVAAADLDRVESFFVTRGSPVNIDLCPLAHPSLIELVKDRGYRIAEFSNVLALALAGIGSFAPDSRIREAAPHEADLWARTAAAGFFEKREYTPEELDVGRTIFHMPGAHCFMGYSPGGEPAATAAMSMRDGLATLIGDSTVPQFRCAGLHTALIRERLNVAIREGCDLATASTLPGSTSQRNYERLGFRVVYTKVGLIK